MTIADRLAALKPADAHKALSALITAYCNPAFGALPKREVDLLLFETLHDLGLLGDDPSIYDLMRELKVSRSKARGLLYDLDIRRADDHPGGLDKDLRDLLATAGFFKDADYFVMEVENPLLQDHIRDRIRRLGFLSDSSFNPALVRLPLAAVSALAEEIIPDDERERVRKALIKAGAPDVSFRGVVEGALRTLAGKVAGQAAGEVASGITGQVADYLGPLFKAAGTEISKNWKSIF